MGEQLDRQLGLLRSLLVYRAIPWRGMQLRRFYRRFLPPQGLAFDVGAHAGNRVAAFRQLGARVVALEPQADFLHLLQRRFGADPQVSLLPQALGRAPGQARLMASPRTPTVATLSTDFVATRGCGAFVSRRAVANRAAGGRDHAGQALIARHGLPDFVKIDVEGFELEVLMGLSQPVGAVSFEFLPALRDVALGCIDRLEALAGEGRYRYAASLGERLNLLANPRVSRPTPCAPGCASMPPEGPSGDVHAWLTRLMFRNPAAFDGPLNVVEPGGLGNVLDRPALS